MKKQMITGLIIGLALMQVACDKEADSDPFGPESENPEDTAPSSWSTTADMKTPRGAHMIAVLENEIYVAGGITCGSSCEKYNPETDRWKKLTDMPTSREYGAACALNGKLYAIGGWWDNVTHAVMEEYDPDKNRWTTKTPMPTKRWGHCAVAMDGKIYVLGGAKDFPITKFYTSVQVYDPETDSWSSLPSSASFAFTPRWGFSACSVNGMIYALGGNTAEDYTFPGVPVASMSTVEAYNPANNTWKEMASMPTARWGLSVVAIDQHIYAIAGSTNFEPVSTLNTLEIYDPVDDSWLRKTPLPKGRISMAACALNNMVYATGGNSIDPYDAFDDVFVYNPASDTIAR